MTFLLTLVALAGAGLALLRLLGLATGRRAVDVPLAWFVGQGWFALGALALRHAAGVPYTAVTALTLVLAPPAGALALAWRRRAAGRPVPAIQPAADDEPPRWRGAARRWRCWSPPARCRPTSRRWRGASPARWTSST